MVPGTEVQTVKTDKEKDERGGDGKGGDDTVRYILLFVLSSLFFLFSLCCCLCLFVCFFVSLFLCFFVLL